MTLSSEPMALTGPYDPQHPLSERRPLAEHLGSQSSVQRFSDGYSYEVAVPKGGGIAALMYQLSVIGGGQIINMWDPADSGDPKDPHFYMQVWVPMEDREVA